jgi:hypothetical protein
VNRIARIAAGMIALAAMTGAAKAGGDEDVASYGLRVTVTAAPGARVQRVELPAAILAAAQTPDLADLRIFDANGRPLPLARTAPPRAPGKRTILRPLPILAPADSLRVTGLSLRLDADGRPRVASLSGTNIASDDSIVAGTLFDTRGVSGPAESLTLEADLPAGQPITFTVEAGPALNDWRRIGETVVYRAPDERAAAVTLPLGDAALHRDYLRVSWRAKGRLLAPVVLRGATLFGGSDAPAEVTLDAVAPPLISAAALEFAVPFATPIASLRVMPTRGAALVPIRILGRDTGEQPWRAIASGIAGTGAPIDTGGAGFRTLRIEAAGPGFAAPPTLRFAFAPRAILFLAAGPPPFTLAAGRAATASAYLPATALTGAGGTAGEARIAMPPAAIQLAASDPGGAQARTLMLWGVLLAATAALGGMAWLLWKRMPAEPA